MRPRVASRHSAHGSETARFFGMYAGMSAGVQADIVSERSRQPLRIAIFSTAGNHERAWLSPKRTIVRDPSIRPYVQPMSSGRPPSCSTWQPSK